ncbi:MAG TPA: glycosyltransferase [Chloroflexi bacterium]|jgi:rhamnosyltransferase|nr:glycosyltransferase [Chloroflexota bacterium]
MPRVSIVIPTRNAGPSFAATLDAIATQDRPPDELLIIDSGSTDGTPERAERFGARVMAIDPSAFGHGRTRNAGIAASTGDLVVLTVQDAIPADGQWLSALVDALTAHPHAAGAYSRSLPRHGAGFIERYLALRDTPATAGDAPIEQRWPSSERLAALSLDELRRCCAFTDGSSILRRTVWAQCPLPDVAYAEDLAWSIAVMRRGYSIVHVPASRVYHSHHRSRWYELRRSYIDRRALLALHANVVPPTEGFDRPAVGSGREVQGLVRDMTARARAEGVLTPRLWCEIRARVLVGAVGVGLANLAARRANGLWPPQFERWLAHGI